MTVPDPLAEVRAEFAAGLDKRIDAMQAALGRLQHEFRVEDARALYQAAHALTGTAGSMGADGLAQAAGDLERLARGWLSRGEAVPGEWRGPAAPGGGAHAAPPRNPAAGPGRGVSPAGGSAAARRCRRNGVSRRPRWASSTRPRANTGRRYVPGRCARRRPGWRCWGS